MTVYAAVAMVAIFIAAAMAKYANPILANNGNKLISIDAKAPTVLIIGINVLAILSLLTSKAFTNQSNAFTTSGIILSPSSTMESLIFIIDLFNFTDHDWLIFSNATWLAPAALFVSRIARSRNFILFDIARTALIARISGKNLLICCKSYPTNCLIVLSKSNIPSDVLFTSIP